MDELGKWEYDLLDGEPYKEEDYDYVLKCSWCGGTTQNKYRFCPHCGKPMDVGGHEDA
jgi:rRNA maturation endonuclease Nob1